MFLKMRSVCLLFFISMSALVSSDNASSIYKIIHKILDQCDKKHDVVTCLKIQAVKIADKAVNSKYLGLLDGLSIVKQSNTTGRTFSDSPINLHDLNLQAKKIDNILWSKAEAFLLTHELQVDVPRLLSGGRRRNNRRRYIWPLAAALAIKGIFMGASYQGVAIMSGTALILGKIALLLSAILALKKLASTGQEKSTTFEIVKHPQFSHSHTHSSYEDDGHHHHSHYHRSLDSGEDMVMQERVYSAYVPQYVHSKMR